MSNFSLYTWEENVNFTTKKSFLLLLKNNVSLSGILINRKLRVLFLGINNSNKVYGTIFSNRKPKHFEALP